jgi:hypothetical protein
MRTMPPVAPKPLVPLARRPQPAVMGRR